MFRPSPQTSLFQDLPIRLISTVLLILALVVSVLLLFGLEHEKVIVQGLSEGKDLPTGFLSGLWQSRYDMLSMTLLLFLLGSIGIAAVITFQHYSSTRRTLEEVKGLARNILESIPTGVVTVDRNGQITAVNPSATVTLQRSTDTLLGQSYEDVFVEGETIRLVLDGVLQSHRHVDHHDMPYDTTGQPRTIRVTTADLAGDDGRSAGAIVLLKDVTELLNLERRVRVADKLTGLHTLSAGVAHELRNPLSAVDLNLHLLEEELKEQGALGKQSIHYIHVLNAECRRLSVILDNFMKFARSGSMGMHEVHVLAAIEHIMALMQFDAEERKILFTHTVETALPPVLGDETQIGQVLLNIVVNAFHAMPDGGQCHITAETRTTDGKHWVEISVKDTGLGIQQEALPRLFEPFYTTNPNGTGLGLAIAYRIMQDHEGTITVSSAPGHGTTVTIGFPAGVGRLQAIGTAS
ncbi:MAG: PAS domain-containing protein [Nitrospira sp.]|nr:PAS domain-containing protein [Nitrospira sp.]